MENWRIRFLESRTGYKKEYFLHSRHKNEVSFYEKSFESTASLKYSCIFTVFYQQSPISSL
jgi:hypothetical protein